MAGSGTFDVSFDAVELTRSSAVGDPGFYLSRKGFWVGAIGVAAVWLGGTEAVASVLTQHSTGDPHVLAHLGAAHARLYSLSTMLQDAAMVVDRLLGDPCTETTFNELQLLARSVRAEVESGAAEILERTGRATGAGPLGHDANHARHVADLTVYLRQSHAERDLAALGALALLLRRTNPSK
jgi:hypothetical protein